MLTTNLSGRPVSFITPDRLILKGFIFSQPRAKTLFIFVHGLSGSLFSRLDIAQELVKSGAAILTFNNRGFGLINNFRRLSKKIGRSGLNSQTGSSCQTETIGEAHEIFTDCVDDLEGAVRFGVKAGYKKIILVGHSTGCNKIAYYLSKKNPAAVKGAVFLGPMSDYASAKKEIPAKDLARVAAYARKMIAENRGHELLSDKVWPEILDAQRFISLFTADSQEEIFSYATPTRKSVILQKTRKPLLIVLAENDEFRDRSMEDIAGWFEESLRGKPAQIKIIKGANHFFSDQTVLVKRVILDWLKGINY